MYPHGMITWTDLNTPNVDRAKEFYGALLGWEAEDIMYGDQPVYVMFRYNGKLAAGMAGQSAEMAERGVPPSWTTYVNVDDVETVAARFTDNGGNLVVPPMDVMDNGRMAYGMDPTGAAIGFWQAGNHRGAEAFNDPGFMTWNELTTRDSAGARDFYTAILPWELSEQDMGGYPYYMFMLGERPVAGIMTMDDARPADTPAHWMTYFRVQDTLAAVAIATEIGGSVPAPPFDTPQGTAAVINDPDGGTFSVIDPAPGQ